MFGRLPVQPVNDPLGALDKEIEMYIHAEFSKDRILEKRIASMAPEQLLSEGFAIPIPPGRYRIESREEFGESTLTIPVDPQNRVLFKIKEVVWISSSNSDRRYIFGNNKHQRRGTVSFISSREISVVFDFTLKELEETIQLDSILEMLVDMTSCKRTEAFKLRLREFWRSSSLLNKICHFCHEVSGDYPNAANSQFEPNFKPLQTVSHYSLLNNDRDNLLDDQESAKNESLRSDDFYLIHGPPGTGKTRTLISILGVLIQEKKRILVSCHSNMSVDKILLEAQSRGILPTAPNSVIRYGDATRADPKTNPFNIKKIATERAQLYRSERSEISHISKVLLRQAQVIFSTQTMIMRDVFYDTFSGEDGLNRFDCLIMDEASQGPFVTSLMPILLSKKLICSGDHNQLPPTLRIERDDRQTQSLFRTSPISEERYKKSLFERLLLADEQRLKLNRNRASISTMLTVQFRMNEIIADTSSKYFYKNKLTANSSNSKIDLQGLSKYRPMTTPHFLNQQTNIVWIDHHFPEQRLDHGFINKEEANLTLHLLLDLVYNIGVDPNQIGIISNYSQQKQLLIDEMGKIDLFKPLLNVKANLEISTVDSFQGREKEIIILSSIRSNGRNDTGFLKDERRLNVSITRAKRLFILIGSRQTLCPHVSFSGGFSMAAGKFCENFYLHCCSYGDLFLFDHNTRKLVKNNEGNKRAFQFTQSSSRSAPFGGPQQPGSNPIASQQRLQIPPGGVYIPNYLIGEGQTTNRELFEPRGMEPPAAIPQSSFNQYGQNLFANPDNRQAYMNQNYDPPNRNLLASTNRSFGLQTFPNDALENLNKLFDRDDREIDRNKLFEMDSSWEESYIENIELRPEQLTVMDFDQYIPVEDKLAQGYSNPFSRQPDHTKPPQEYSQPLIRQLEQTIEQRFPNCTANQLSILKRYKVLLSRIPQELEPDKLLCLDSVIAEQELFETIHEYVSDRPQAQEEFDEDFGLERNSESVRMRYNGAIFDEEEMMEENPPIQQRIKDDKKELWEDLLRPPTFGTRENLNESSMNNSQQNSSGLYNETRNSWIKQRFGGLASEQELIILCRYEHVLRRYQSYPLPEIIGQTSVGCYEDLVNVLLAVNDKNLVSIPSVDKHWSQTPEADQVRPKQPEASHLHEMDRSRAEPRLEPATSTNKRFEKSLSSTNSSHSVSYGNPSHLDILLQDDISTMDDHKPEDQWIDDKFQKEGLPDNIISVFKRYHRLLAEKGRKFETVQNWFEDYELQGISDLKQAIQRAIRWQPAVEAKMEEAADKPQNKTPIQPLTAHERETEITKSRNSFVEQRQMSNSSDRQANKNKLMDEQSSQIIPPPNKGKETLQQIQTTSMSTSENRRLLELENDNTELKAAFSNLQKRCQQLEAENEKLMREKKAVERQLSSRDEAISKLTAEATRDKDKIRELTVQATNRVSSCSPFDLVQSNPPQYFNPFD